VVATISLKHKQTTRVKVSVRLRNATVLPAPTVEGLFRNTVIPTKLANCDSLAIRFLQNANDLLLTESRTLHQNPPFHFLGILTYLVVQFSGSRAARNFLIFFEI